MQKYQVIEVVGSDGFFGAFAIVNTRTNRTIKTFEGEDYETNKSLAMNFVQSCVEDDRWNAANR